MCPDQDRFVGEVGSRDLGDYVEPVGLGLFPKAGLHFQLDGDPRDWTLRFVPDAESMMTLREAFRDSR